MDLFWLNDSQWRAIQNALPSRQTGPKRNDDRVVISGIVHVLRSGRAWRDCPPDYGPYMTVFNRFNRWKRSGVWGRIATALASVQSVPAVVMPDGSPLSDAVAKRSRATNPPHPALPQAPRSSAWLAASNDLYKLAQAHHGKPREAWIDAIVEWHMDSLFAYTAALDGNSPPLLSRLARDFSGLQAELLRVLIGLRLYVDGPALNGAQLQTVLRGAIDSLSKRPGARAEAS